MSPSVAASPAPASAPPARVLRRDRRRGVLGGVCAGVAERLGADPLPVRVAFIAAAAAGGLGVGVYLLAWALVPADEAASPEGARTGRAALEVGAGAALLGLSALFALRGLGLWLSDAVVWPAVLVAAGVALLWRQSARGGSEAQAEARPRAATAPAPQPELDLPARAAVVSRTGLGIALVVAAGLVFLQATGSLSAARDVVLAALVAAIVLGLIFAPWIVRLVRSLADERARRIRSQERAEVAAHLHDSVLQTLALVQRRAESPRDVAALARRQERELRAWLSGRRPAPGERRLASALEAAAEDVERAHGVPVEVVTVGDAPLDEAGEALVAAAREAMLNAAKFAGTAPVDVYAERTDEHMQVFVRDRGPGFDPQAAAQDRRGVRESIVGRMARHGGRVAINSGAEGTEVELSLDVRPA